MEITWKGYQQGGGGGIMWGKVQGRRSINGRYKIDRGRLRIVSEMEKTKNLCVSPMDMNQGVGGMWVGDGLQGRGGKGDNCNSIINKIYLKN